MTGDRFERAILDVLRERREGASICPSEAARWVAGDDEDAWRPLMEPIRDAARELARNGQVRVMQCGEEVDAATASGPIRIRLA